MPPFSEKPQACQCQESRYFNFGSKKFARKSSNRTCNFCGSSPRFLQYLLFSPQKIGAIPSSDKSETPQPVSQNSAFQNGHYEDSSDSSKERRLGFVCRPKRCIFSHLNPSKSQKVSKVLHKREGLSVPSFSFWPKNSPRFFTNVIAVAAAHLRMQSIRLAVYLGDWLALNAIKQMLLRDRILNLLSRLGFSDKLRKVKSGADTRYYIHQGSQKANIAKADHCLKAI